VRKYLPRQMFIYCWHEAWSHISGPGTTIAKTMTWLSGHITGRGVLKPNDTGRIGPPFFENLTWQSSPMRLPRYLKFTRSYQEEVAPLCLRPAEGPLSRAQERQLAAGPFDLREKRLATLFGMSPIVAYTLGVSQ
jgi:hypothetical protein